MNADPRGIRSRPTPTESGKRAITLFAACLFCGIVQAFIAGSPASVPQKSRA
jgi:hypothetical protein